MVPIQIIRQVLILTGMGLCSISEGYILGQMSGMVTALRAADSDIPMSDNDVNLIASTIHLTSVLGFIIAVVVTDRIGRRLAVAVLSAPNVLNWLVVYHARSTGLLLATRAVVGVCFGGVIMLILITTSEYMSPNLRGLFLSLISAVGPAVGVMIGHVLSVLLDWRTTALMGIIPSILSALFPLLWVESPQWLASKGRFEECQRAFRALHGHRDRCEEELRLLINVERKKINESKRNNSCTVIKTVISASKKKYFWKLLILNILIIIYLAATSRIIFQTYAITMLQEMTGSSNVLLFTIAVDGLAVLGSCISCVILSSLKLRTLLFTAGLMANVVLLVVSGTLYWHSDNIYFSWIKCVLLGLYFVIQNAGSLPVLSAYTAEMFPVELKGFYMVTMGGVTGATYFISVTYTPALLSALNYYGLFVLNTIVMFVCLGVFWIYLPETKGKSLQEIELHFKKNTFDITHEENDFECEEFKIDGNP